MCRDVDGDTCDDCSSGTDAPSNDGTDTDGDGQCDAGDADDDNDGVADGSDSAPLDPFVCSDVDGDTCDDCSLGASITVLATGFDVDEDGFVYSDDTFRATAEPGYASGQWVAAGGFTGGGLIVELGGINNANITGMSGGWAQTFVLSVSAPVTLSFRYNLTQLPDYESDEFSQVLVSVDGVLYGEPPDDYVAQIVGDGENGPVLLTTGWQMFEVDLGVLGGAKCHPFQFRSNYDQR